MRKFAELTDPIVYSAYWDNIDASVLASQAAVFNKLGIELRQVNTQGEHHGAWMTRMAETSEDDFVIFCDIDAFPLGRGAYEKAIDVAKAGGIFGMAQVANHLAPSKIYAAPSFLAFSKETYIKLGQPSLCHTDELDPAQLLTDVAYELGAQVHLLYPGTFIIPKWPLANYGVYGIGTFYGKNEFFHLFESRFSVNIQIFNAVSEGVVAGELDFAQYLDLAQVPREPIRRKRFRGIRKLLRGLRK